MIQQWLVQYGVAVAAVVIAITLITLILIGVRGRGRYPYQAMPSLFSAAELRFLRALEQAVDNRVRVYAKVRIADVVKVRSGLDSSRFYRAFNAIACKHVDYVLCAADSCAIIAVIELDDRSHQRADRRRRDEFVDAVMQAAGIPILHIPIQAHYNLRDLKTHLRDVLDRA